MLLYVVLLIRRVLLWANKVHAAGNLFHKLKLSCGDIKKKMHQGAVFVAEGTFFAKALSVSPERLPWDFQLKTRWNAN